jgi:hypothetical protein
MNSALSLTLMFAGFAPGTQGSSANQEWQDALTTYITTRVGSNVQLACPSRMEDPDHDLHVTLTGDTEEEIRAAYLSVPAFPDTVKLQLKKVKAHRSYTEAAKTELDKALMIFSASIPLEVTQDPEPARSHAKCG